MIRLFLPLLFLFMTLASTSQTTDLPKIDFKSYDFPRSVVVEIDGYDKSDLKQKLMQWIEVYFSEDELISQELQGDAYRISAKEFRFFEIKNLPTELYYDLKISLKNNRYKFEITYLKYKYYTELVLINNIDLIQDQKIKQDLEQSRSQLQSFFNTMNLELHKSIRTEAQRW